MKRIVLTFGLISGAVIATLMAATMPLVHSGRIPFSKGELVGYSSMVLAFILVFFGIRSYRDNVGGGFVTFGRAFKVGILITLITCAVYVITWEILYFNFMPDFLDKYVAATVDRMRSEGASGAEIAAMQTRMAELMELYKNPLINVGMTFLEIFPVGLIMTLVSAAILRNRKAPGVAARAAA